jgi:hypothetical protein
LFDAVIHRLFCIFLMQPQDKWNADSLGDTHRAIAKFFLANYV